MSIRRSETIREAEFDPRLMAGPESSSPWIMLITVVGAPLIPFWLLWSINYAPKALAECPRG